MGHVIDYMVFDRKTPRKKMLEAVESWAKANVDPYEHSEDGNIWNINVYDGSLNGDRAWHETPSGGWTRASMMTMPCCSMMLIP